MALVISWRLLDSFLLSLAMVLVLGVGVAAAVEKVVRCHHSVAGVLLLGHGIGNFCGSR